MTDIESTHTESTKPWVWFCLGSILVLLAVGVLYLDRQIIKSSQENAKKRVQNSDKQKPTIDFYTVLENRELDILVPEDQIDGLENPSINKQAVAKVTLQAGSFLKESDARILKDELHLLGLESQINLANVNNATWYRVVIGPFESNSEISQAKNKLLEKGIKYVQRRVQ